MKLGLIRAWGPSVSGCRVKLAASLATNEGATSAAKRRCYAQHDGDSRPANSGDGSSRGRARWNARSRAHPMVVVAGPGVVCGGGGGKLGGDRSSGELEAVATVRVEARG